MAQSGNLRRGSVLLTLIMGLGLLPCASAQGGQPAPPILDPGAMKQVSAHVWVIEGHGRPVVPNVGIIVGSRATMIVDTGLGPRNGQIVVEQVKKLGKGPDLYLTTTHYHPEHTAGEPAFPPNTKIIRPIVQQEEMERMGPEFMARFAKAPMNKGLLDNVTFRHPDILFDRETRIDLGGVTARLLWFGAAHTQGDELIMVDEDGVLLPGDIVENRMFPGMPDADSSGAGWIAVLDKVEALHPRFIVPDHGELGDASLIAGERMILKALESRSQELKAQGKPLEEAQKTLDAEFRAKYPGWAGSNWIAPAVTRFYAEAK